jgi:hypothetical protein
MDDEKRHAEYTEPSCIAEGEALRARFVGDIERISLQLGDRNKLNADGKRLTDHEYHTWRKSALCALNARRVVVRRLNIWLDAARRQAQVSKTHGPVVSASYAMVDAAYRLFQQLAKDDVEFEEDEWKVVESLRAYLDQTHVRAA